MLNVFKKSKTKFFVSTATFLDIKILINIWDSSELVNDDRLLIFGWIIPLKLLR